MNKYLIPFTKIKCEKAVIWSLYTTGKIYEVDASGCITMDNGEKYCKMPDNFTLVEEVPMSKWKSTTRCGYDVVIHTENGKGDKPIIGQYRSKVSKSFRWYPHSWFSNGKSADEGQNAIDLIPKVDIDKFYSTVFSGRSLLYSEGDDNEVYNRARQWFIDHPEELLR